MVDPDDYMALIDRFPKETDTPDMIDFFWWSDDEMLNLIFDSERFMALDEETMYDLVWQLGKRYQEALDNDSAE